MSWLRIDDRFAFHPKVGELARADRWTWMEVLCHCAAQRTGGRIPTNITELYRHVTPRFLSKATEAGLVDTDENGALFVHDWDVYNGGNLSERVANFLEKHPESSANEVHKEVGGKREIVLALVAEHKAQSENTGTPNGTPPGTREPEGNQVGTGSGTGTRARAALPQPVLSPSLETEEQDQEPSFLPTPTRDVEEEGTDFNGRAKTEADLVAERELNYEIPDVAFQDIPS